MNNYKKVGKVERALDGTLLVSLDFGFHREDGPVTGIINPVEAYGLAQTGAEARLLDSVTHRKVGEVVRSGKDILVRVPGRGEAQGSALALEHIVFEAKSAMLLSEPSERGP